MDGSGGSAVLVKSPYQHGQTRLGVNVSERVVFVQACLVTDSLEECEAWRREIINCLTPIHTGDLVVFGDSFTRVFENVQVVDGPTFLDQDYTVPDGILYFNFSAVVPSNFLADLEWLESKLVEVMACFEFPLSFQPNIIVGDIEKGQIILQNNGDVETPIRIEIPGYVETPTIKNLTTGEFIKIYTPIRANEKMYIDTSFGNKSVVIIDDNGNKRNAFNYIDLNSTFFQLALGENLIRFNAEVGNDTANVKIYYKQLYFGL